LIPPETAEMDQSYYSSVQDADMIFLSSLKHSHLQFDPADLFTYKIPVPHFLVAFCGMILESEDMYVMRISFPESVKEVQPLLGDSDHTLLTTNAYKIFEADVDAAKAVWELEDIQTIGKELGSFGKLARRTWLSKGNSSFYCQDFSETLDRPRSWWKQPKLFMLLLTT
jgi:hypothetical protein